MEAEAQKQLVRLSKVRLITMVMRSRFCNAVLDKRSTWASQITFDESDWRGLTGGRVASRPAHPQLSRKRLEKWSTDN